MLQARRVLGKELEELAAMDHEPVVPDAVMTMFS
jgi:hypothetical protein